MNKEKQYKTTDTVIARNAAEAITNALDQVYTGSDMVIVDSAELRAKYAAFASHYPTTGDCPYTFETFCRETIEGHREPTAYEIRFGYGATHYREFLLSDIVGPDGQLPPWYKADDGLRYYFK